MAIPTYKVVLENNIEVTKNVRKLIFKFNQDEQFIYKPGQFVSFLLPSGGEKPFKRSYSIANLEGQVDENGQIHTNYLEIIIAYVENGKASELFFNAQPGLQLDISGPVGLLVLLEELPKRVFLIGTGTGVAPYRAMLEQIKSYPDTEFHIMFGAQYLSDMFYLDDFYTFAEQPNCHFHPCLSRELPDSKGCRQGYVQTALEELKPNPEHDLVYLCGNPHMVDEVFTLLKDKEFGVKQVKREKYVFSKY